MRSKLLLSTTLILCALLIVYAMQGRLSLYIHPRYVDFTATITVIGSFLLLVAWPGRSKATKLQWIIFIGVLLGALLPPRSLSQSIAANRSTTQYTDAGSSSITSFEAFSQDLSRFSLQDWQSYLATNPKPEQIAGIKATITGFLYTESSGQKFVARFRVTCCAVDATPLKVPLKDYEQLRSIAEGQWITASGIFVKATDQYPYQLEAATITPIDEPGNPYVF